MKMEEGISTAAIVAIVVTVVVVAVAVPVVILLKGGGGPSGLSLYPGSQSWEIPSDIRENIPAGVEVAGYTVSGVSAQDILNWYKCQMTGWTLKMGGVETGILIYRNGNDGAAIVAMSGTGLPGTCYILATAPWSTFVEMFGGGTTTTTTTGGGGLAALPVYPEAQAAEENVAQQIITSMLVSMGSPSGWSGKVYATQASPEIVIGWYRTQMSGWTKFLDNTTESMGVTCYILVYLKGNDMAAIATFVYPDVGNFLLLAARPTPTTTTSGG